jgi:xanthine dehydrogenase accessory factor
MRRETLDALNRARAACLAIVRACDLKTGEESLVDPVTDRSPLGIAAADAARADQSREAEVGGRTWFLSVYNPPLDLAIVGAVHIAQPLARMAALAGYQVRIIDPRTAFASAERFPGVALSHDWPDEALEKAPLGFRSALVALTHDPKLDDPALRAALADPGIHEKLVKSGAVPSPTTPEEFAQFLKDELARWGKVIREKGIKEGWLSQSQVKFALAH